MFIILNLINPSDKFASISHKEILPLYEYSKSCVWIIVVGGYREYDQSNNTDLLITGCDVTVIIELGMF